MNRRPDMKIMPIEKCDIVEMDIDKIDVSKQNSRRQDLTERIKEIASSITKIDIQQPPIAQKNNNRYELIIGQRRLFVFRELKRKKIPILLKNKPYKNESDKITSIVENIHRKDMNPKDIAKAGKFTYEKTKSRKQSAEILGISIITFNKYLGFCRVPKESKKLMNEKILSVQETKYLWQIVPNVANAKKLAHMISKLSKSTRDRYFTTLSDYLSATPEQIKKKTENMKDVISFKIHISMSHSTSSFVNASESEELDYPALGQKDIAEYPSSHGY